MITTPAPGKVNLILRVGPRGADGYHPLRTLFCALELADEVEVRPAGPAGEVTLAVEWDHDVSERHDLGPPASNLAVRAATAYLQAAGLETGVDIRLRKRLPVGGGLGGGSSDAAAVLRALHQITSGALPREELGRIAAGLGSDVPFFLADAPLAWGEGRGDRLTPARPLPSKPVLLVIPPFPVSTADAYAWLDETRRGDPPTGTDTGREEPSWSWIEQAAVNDIEPVVFRRHPELVAVRAALTDAGARLALLSGSGSTLFGVFDDVERLEEGARLATAAMPAARAVATRTATANISSSR